jgi:hypothetical protein
VHSGGDGAEQFAAAGGRAGGRIVGRLSSPDCIAMMPLQAPRAAAAEGGAEGGREGGRPGAMAAKRGRGQPREKQMQRGRGREERERAWLPTAPVRVADASPAIARVESAADEALRELTLLLQDQPEWLGEELRVAVVVPPVRPRIP